MSLVAGDQLTGVVDVPAEELRTTLGALLDGGRRLALVAGHHDTRPRSRGPRTPAVWVVYLLVGDGPGERVELHVRAPLAEPQLPSVFDLSFPGGRFERELQDLFGIVPTGHPDPARLVLHPAWPAGWHPLRHDAGEPVWPAPGTDAAVATPDRFLTVDGNGVYEIPVGPIHAGLIEPGHFRFSVVGETILAMEARLWFVHRGIERLFQGRDVHAGVELAQRISGDTAVGHTLAYCLAVEEACGRPVPGEASVLRAVQLELERLHNHVADIGALCNDVGFGVIQAHALRIREQLLRLNADVTGHRLLRGGIAPGGASVLTLPTMTTLDAIAEDVHQLVEIAVANSVVVDRFRGTAVLDRPRAADLGVLGPPARASGIDDDTRRSHPFAPGLYDRLQVPGATAGDVFARFRLRVDELDASVALLRELLDVAVPGTHGDLGWKVPRRAVRRGGRPAHGVGLVEGWRGRIAHRVELAADGTLGRVKVVDPSFFNWPALSVALADTIVPDFPLANKSFNLSYAGNDL